MINFQASKLTARAREAQIKFYNLSNADFKNNSSSPRRIKTFDKQTLTELLELKKLFSNQVLNAFSDASFVRLLPHFELVSLSFDEEICRPGDSLSHVYFPETAVISFLHVLTDGNSAEIAMVGPESIVGLAEMFGAQISNYWTQVTTAGHALRIKTEILREEFERGDPLRKILGQSFNSHLAQISQRVVCNVHHQTEARFGNWLLMLQDRTGRDTLWLTQDQIARYLGVHRPSITHIAQSLREKQIINYVRGHIKIINRLNLKKIACECYQTLKNPFSIEFGETIQ